MSSPAPATVTLMGGGGTAVRASAGEVAGGDGAGPPAIRADARAGVTAMMFLLDFLGFRRRRPRWW